MSQGKPTEHESEALSQCREHPCASSDAAGSSEEGCPEAGAKISAVLSQEDRQELCRVALQGPWHGAGIECGDARQGVYFGVKRDGTGTSPYPKEPRVVQRCSGASPSSLCRLGSALCSSSSSTQSVCPPRQASCRGVWPPGARLGSARRSRR